MKSLLLCLAIIVSITACNSEPRIDASSEEKMQKSVAEAMKTLSLDEQEKFQDSLQVIMFGSVKSLIDLAAMGQNIEVTKGAFQAKVDGKTAKEIIQIAEEIRQKRQNGNFGRAKAKTTDSKNQIDKIVEEAQSQTEQELLNKTINVTLKKIKAVQGKYQKHIEIEVAFENISDKNIRGIKGVAVFDDIFGDRIKALNLSSDEQVLKGRTYVYKGSIDVNQFSNKDLKLARTPKEKIQFSFQIDTILFAEE